MPSFFKPNPNLGRELEQQPEHIAGLAKATEPAKDLAKQFAPVRSGSYRDGIQVIVHDRKVFLSGTYWTSGFIEFGTVDTPVFAPLRRGATAAGLKFKESSR